MEWFVKPGQHVDEMDKLCLVESDKAAVEITSRYKGEVKRLMFNAMDKVKIGSVIVEIDDGKEVQGSVEDVEKVGERAVSPSSIGSTQTPTSPAIQATPAVRALAKEKGVDLSKVTGTGPSGRITKEDVLTAGHVLSTTPTSHPSQTPSQLIKLSGVHLAMAKSMIASSSVPHLSLTEEIHVDDLLRVIKELKSVAQERFGLRTITITSLLVKAISLALSDYPTLNSKFRQINDELYVERFESHNIGVAMDAPRGLVVPNIKGVDNLSIVDIQKELFALQERAQAGRLTIEDLKGGTASISNIGVIGGIEAKSLLFDGQSLIVAVGRIRIIPGYLEEGEEKGGTDDLVKKQVMNLTWSADHRAVDGATVARFSNRFKELLESPERMMIDLS